MEAPFRDAQIEFIGLLGEDSIGDRYFVLTKDHPSMIIGRSSRNKAKSLQAAENNAYFDSPVMSRTHALIETDGQGNTTLRDTDSMHGTHFEGRELGKDEPIEVMDGITVTFGSEVCRGAESFPPKTFQIGLIHETAKSNMAPVPQHEERHRTCTGYGVTSEELILSDGDSEDEYDEDDELFGGLSTRSPTDGTGYSKACSPIEILDEVVEVHDISVKVAVPTEEKEDADDVEIVMESYVASPNENRNSKMAIKELISEGIPASYPTWQACLEKIRWGSEQNQRLLDGERAKACAKPPYIHLDDDSDEEQRSTLKSMPDEKYGCKGITESEERVPETQKSESEHTQGCIQAYSPKSPTILSSPFVGTARSAEPLHIPREVEQAWCDTWRLGSSMRQTDLLRTEPKTVSGDAVNLPDLVTRTKLAFEQVTKAGEARQRAEEFLRIRREIDGQKYLPEPSIIIPHIPMPVSMPEKGLAKTKESHLVHRPCAYPESPLSCSGEYSSEEDSDFEEDEEDVDRFMHMSVHEHESPLTSPMVAERPDKHIFASINDETEDENAGSDAMEADDTSQSLPNWNERSASPSEQIDELEHSATCFMSGDPNPQPPTAMGDFGPEQSFYQAHNDNFSFRRSIADCDKWSALHESKVSTSRSVLDDLPSISDFKSLKRSFDEYNDDPYDKENIEDQYEYTTTFTDAQPPDAYDDSISADDQSTKAVADDSSIVATSSHTIELEKSVKRIKLTDKVTNDDGWVKSIKAVVVPTLVGAVLGSAGMFAALVASASAE